MNHPPVSRGSGFTLIEVTLAVGISAIALVGLLAMLPQGVMTMKRATDTAIEARIHQQIVAEISQTDWQRRGSYDYRAPGSNIRYFDGEGIQVPNSEADDAIYSVRLSLPGAENGGSTIPLQLPQRLGGMQASVFDSSGTNQGDALQLVLMEVTSAPSVKTSEDFDREINWPGIHTYRSTLVRLIDTVSATASNP